MLYLFLNAALIYFVIKFRNEILILPAILILGLVSSVYIHHQDYLLALVALIILLPFASQMNSKLIDFFQIGLQPNSFLLHLTTYSLRVFQFRKEKPVSYSWFPLCFSLITAYFWYIGKLDTSFLIYDFIYMATVFLILYKNRNLIKHA